jgi:hypothetical protein
MVNQKIACFQKARPLAINPDILTKVERRKIEGMNNLVIIQITWIHMSQ